jgi:SAM-dependent methyltransferase
MILNLEKQAITFLRSNKMNSMQKQGELWGQAPSDWAFLQEPKHNPLFEAMLSAANVGKATQMLDAGCGGGGASVLAAERGAQVSGLDAAEGLINLARERVPSGDFRVGDIQDLPYEDESFDVVIAPNSIQYAEDHVAALRELGRVCKSDGRIVVGLFAEAEQVEYRHIFKVMVATLPEAPKGGGPFTLSAPGVLEGLVEKAGLTILETKQVNCPFAYPDFETFWRGKAAAGPTQSIIRIVGVEKLKSALRQAVGPYLTQDGRIEISPNYFKYIVAAL